MRTYIQRRAARLGIEFIDRFNAETLEKILAVRENLLLLKFSRQPKVLVIYNKDDDSDAFVNNGFRQLFESGFDVVYFEAADVADINWLEAEITSANLERAFSILQLGGHGTLQDIQFGKLSGFDARRPGDDFAKSLGRLQRFLIPGSDIVLDSCGTGAGEEKIVNVANAIGMMFPDSRVHAPRVSIICGRIEFDSAKLIKVRYLEGPIGYIRQAT